MDFLKTTISNWQSVSSVSRSIMSCAVRMMRRNTEKIAAASYRKNAESDGIILIVNPVCNFLPTVGNKNELQESKG